MSKFNIGDKVIFSRAGKIHDGEITGVLENTVGMPPTYVVGYVDEYEAYEPNIRRFGGER